MNSALGCHAWRRTGGLRPTPGSSSCLSASPAGDGPTECGRQLRLRRLFGMQPTECSTNARRILQLPKAPNTMGRTRSRRKRHSPLASSATTFCFFQNFGGRHASTTMIFSANELNMASRNSSGMRLANCGLRAKSAKKSLKKGRLPSTLAVPVSGKHKRLAAKAPAAANEGWEVHRLTQTATAGPQKDAGAARARRLARSLAASWLQRPPSSRARAGRLTTPWLGSLFCFLGQEERSPGRAATSTTGGACRSQGGNQRCCKSFRAQRQCAAAKGRGMRSPRESSMREVKS